MKSTRTKNTKRFAFQVETDPKAHTNGCNRVTITTKSYDSDNGKYGSGVFTPEGTTVTMTVQEAKALNNFLNKTFTS